MGSQKSPKNLPGYRRRRQIHYVWDKDLKMLTNNHWEIRLVQMKLHTTTCIVQRIHQNRVLVREVKGISWQNTRSAIEHFTMGKNQDENIKAKRSLPIFSRFIAVLIFTSALQDCLIFSQQFLTTFSCLIEKVFGGISV